MNTTSNLLVEDCGVDNSVKAIIEEYGINPKHLVNVIDTHNGKLRVIKEAEIYKAAKKFEEENRWAGFYTITDTEWLQSEGVRSRIAACNLHPATYWELERHGYWQKIKQNILNENNEIIISDCTEEEINIIYDYYLKKYNIDCKWIPYIDRNRFVMLSYYTTLMEQEDLSISDSPYTLAINYWYREERKRKYQKLQEEERKQQQALEAVKKERRKAAEAEWKELQAELKQKKKEYNALAAKGQFLFDNLLIQRSKNSTSFLLPNENNKKITAYGIIERLTGDKFKSYRKQIKIKNDKIQILPFSERIRLIFYFRQQYRTPPLLDNADTVAAFLNTARKYTSNIQLNQNWSACLNVTNTPEGAASLLAYYGWAADFAEEYPHTENAFYTVDVRSGARHYNIVHDDITLRFMAVEWEGRSPEAYEIISNKEMQYKEKYNALQELLTPCLWHKNGVKMGLTRSAREQCYERISDYINNLLEHNAFDCISLEEHIRRVTIDKSETGIDWAEPRQFTISMDDMEFLDYQYNIDAEYNKANAAELGAARSEKAAQRNMKKIIGNIGDILATQELYAMGIDKNKISRLIKNGKIERTKRGYYRIISS